MSDILSICPYTQSLYYNANIVNFVNLFQTELHVLMIDLMCTLLFACIYVVYVHESTHVHCYVIVILDMYNILTQMFL